MEFRKSTLNDIDRIMQSFSAARKRIASLGINQWQYRDGYASEGSMSLYRKTSYFGSVKWDEDALNALFLR